MSVSDGQNVNAAVTNAAFMSRLVDTSTIGVVTLNNTTDPNSGASITNLQRAINELFDASGLTGEGDATRKTYSSNNVVTNGDDRKVAIGKLDAQFDPSTGHTHDGADSPNVAGSDVTYDNATSGLTATDVQAAIDELDSSVDVTPKWQSFTVAHGALQAAASVNDIELAVLAAKAVIHAVVIKHTTAFAGTGITAYRVSVGITGNLDKYALEFDVLQAVGDQVFDVNNSLDMEDFVSTASIRIAAVSEGANLDQSSAGSVDIHLLTSALPA